MAPKSTLAEVNSAMRDYFYHFLSTRLPVSFADTRQVLLTPKLGLRSDFVEYERRSTTDSTGEGQVKLPFGAISRDRGIAGSQGGMNIDALHRKFFRHQFIDPSTKESGTVRSWRMIPVTLLYSGRVYAASFNDLENIVEALLFSTPDHMIWNFNSDLLGGLERSLTIHLAKEPTEEPVPDIDEVTKKLGRIYGLQIPLAVSCSLGITEMQKVILAAHADVIDGTGPDQADPENLIETISVEA